MDCGKLPPYGGCAVSANRPAEVLGKQVERPLPGGFGRRPCIVGQWTPAVSPLPRRIQIGWQVFIRGEQLVEHWTRYETCMFLVGFRALCADCGQPFTAKATKTNWRAKQVSRRCEKHRRLGAYVDNLKSPIAIVGMPHWAKPDRDRIKQTAKRKRYGAARAQKLPPRPRTKPRAPQTPPAPSYLD
jgi:hypothetical protein